MIGKNFLYWQKALFIIEYIPLLRVIKKSLKVPFARHQFENCTYHLCGRTHNKLYTLYKGVQRFCLDLIVSLSKSIKSNLHKATNCIKRTPFHGPNIVRFSEIPLHLQDL